MKFSWHKTGLLQIIIVSVLLIWIVFRYQHTLNQLHPEWIMLGLGLGLLWSLRHNLHFPLILLLLIGGMLLYQWLFVLPSTMNWLQREISAESKIMVNGRIRQRVISKENIRLNLNNVEVFKGKHTQWLPEIILNLPKTKRRISSFYLGRHLQVIGRLNEVSVENNRLSLTFSDFRYRNAITPQSSLSRRLDSWVMQLTDRARFYLSNQALSLYLPLTLAKRTYTSRETAKTFRESGMAHLLAISGLHIGMIYGIFLLLVRGLGRLSNRVLENPHYHASSHLISLTGIWIYLLLIGMPTPAFRAVCMLSMLVAGRLLGQIHQPLYALFATALFFIFLNPAVIYEISFQLSFIAVFFILWFLPLYPLTHENDSFRRRLLKYCLISIGITTAVMLGTGPVVAATFERITLETFWLNLVMVLLLGILVLPCCLLALLVSALSLGNLPFGFFEKNIFSLTEMVVESWYAILQNLHSWGSWASFNITLDWGPPHFILYYTFILGLSKLLIYRFQKRN